MQQQAALLRQPPPQPVGVVGVAPPALVAATVVHQRQPRRQSESVEHDETVGTAAVRLRGPGAQHHRSGRGSRHRRPPAVRRYQRPRQAFGVRTETVEQP